MNRKMWIGVIILVMVVLGVVTICIYVSNEGVTINEREVDCYDKYDNEIVGLTCIEEYGDKVQQNLIVYSTILMGIFFGIGSYILYDGTEESLWKYINVQTATMKRTQKIK